MNIRKLFTFRVIILIILIILSVIFINPVFNTDGVAIRSVEINSSSYNNGMIVPVNANPRDREIIHFINDRPVSNVSDFSRITENLRENDTVKITTDKKQYAFILENDNLGVSVSEPATTNLRKGLDLEGGSRVILKPVDRLNDEDFKNLIDTMQLRLNTFGLSDIKVRAASDLSGEKFVIVEVAGATKEDIKELVAGQGKFEAKIGNETAFVGSKKDIVFVCRGDGICSNVRQCQDSGSGYSCQFEFAITLSPEAAKKHADITKNIDINLTNSGQPYLSKSLDLYLDDILVDSLRISGSLKGQEITDISISGPGSGSNRREAVNDATRNMNKLQTILITGSLPTKLDVVDIQTISPVLGKAFVSNAINIGILAILAVAIVIFVRYRKIKITIPVIITGISEVIIILGFSAIAKINLDLSAVAGIIAAVGTGVDDQIVIMDEILGKAGESIINWKEKIKRAFFIIFTAYFTAVGSMFPLLFAGAGLLKGFALTTIIGVTVGVFVTRPAFASIIEFLIE